MNKKSQDLGELSHLKISRIMNCYYELQVYIDKSNIDKSLNEAAADKISVRAQCLTILLFKHFAPGGTITGSSYCSARCKMLK